jgi:exopolysaccharide production protein ExoQ
MSLGLLLVLVLTSPVIQMTGELGSPFKSYRVSGYAALAVLQAILLVARGWRTSLRAFATPALAVLIWFAISLLWAAHPELAIKRFLLIFLVYISIFSAGVDLEYRRFINILRIGLAVILLLNLATVLLFPGLGINEGHHHQWRGIMANKNIAGIVCAVTVVIFVFDGRKISPIVRLGVISCSVVFLYMSWSRTPIVALPVALMFGFVIARFKIPFERSNEFCIAALVLFAVAIASIGAFTIEKNYLLSLTDDAGALSLRNAIWRPMLTFYFDNALLGAGYGSYWDAEIDPQNIEAFSTQAWLGEVNQAHNGYLDLLVQTGLPGLALSIFAAITWPLLRFIPMVTRQPQRASLIFSLICLLLIENLTETSLFSGDVFGNFMIFCALSLIHRFELKAIKSHQRIERVSTHGPSAF